MFRASCVIFVALVAALVPACGTAAPGLSSPLDGDWTVTIGPPASQVGACLAIRDGLVVAWTRGCASGLAVRNTSEADGSPLFVRMSGANVAIEVYVTGLYAGSADDVLVTLDGLIGTDGSISGTATLISVARGIEQTPFSMFRL